MSTVSLKLRLKQFSFPTLNFTRIHQKTVFSVLQGLEIVKCGFWRKLPLFYHFCGAPTQLMKISDFPIYSFTNDLLLQFIRLGLYERSQLHPIGYFIIPTIYYNVRNLLYGSNFS